MNLPINLLPAGASNLVSTDRIPYDQDLGGGNWVTKYHTGLEIINGITGLATTSFPNINTSINNAINTAVAQVDTNLHILGRDDFAATSIASGVSINFDTLLNINSLPLQADKIYTLKVRIQAYRLLGAAALRTQEYNISISTDSSLPSPFLQIVGGGGSSNFVFNHANAAGANISINTSGFSITSGGKLRCNITHSISGATIHYTGHYSFID